MASHDRLCIDAQRFGLTLILALACATAAATEFAGRGVFTFDSASGCPFADLSGAAPGCNRVALDSTDTRAAIDRTAHTIRFANDRTYERKTVVGDVLLHGTGEAGGGQRVPLSVHLVLSKQGDKWTVNRHTHASTSGDFTKVQVDLYQVEVVGSKGAHALVTPAEITQTVTEPGLVARMASELVQVRDNRRKDAHAPDITIAVGAGKLAKPVMRARLHIEPAATQGLDVTLKQGTWAVELEALTGHLPDGVIQRELFLYNLDRNSLMQALLKRGLQKHEKLTLGAVHGEGFLRLGAKQQAFPEAESSARAFLQNSFVGLILGAQALDKDAGNVR